MADFRKSSARESFESIVIAVILALFIRTFVVQAFKIPTGSMENNLLVGDHLPGGTDEPVVDDDNQSDRNGEPRQQRDDL